MTGAVVVTRDEPRDGPLGTSLRARGLEVLWWPVVRISLPAEPQPLEEALARAAEFDWIVFASRHAVEAVASRCRQPQGARIAAVGAATAAALRAHGWTPDVAPAEGHAEALVAALAAHVTPGAHVLFPASSRALPTLGEGLRRLGARVLQVEAYRNEAAPLDVAACRATIDAGVVGAVTFTSPSGVEELEHALGRDAFARLLAQRMCVRAERGPAERGPAERGPAFAVALGPTTAGALAARGIEPILAAPATLEGLAATTSQNLNRSKH
ncbi:MAG: uroporphyrinogen-III synthase [Steroidobacteraceae bacterium]